MRILVTADLRHGLVRPRLSARTRIGSVDVVNMGGTCVDKRLEVPDGGGLSAWKAEGMEPGAEPWKTEREESHP
jgi:hypothetical protein